MMRLRQDSVVDFLHERAPDEAHLPNGKPDGMCILSGQILIQNLERSLLRRGIPSEAFVRFRTIERLAEDLLSGDSRASSVLNHRLRARLIKKIFERATGGDTTETWACSQEELEAIQELARNLVYQEQATMEEFGKEFDDYLRWTDASETHSGACGTIDVLSDDFVSLKSRRSLDAFHGISKELQRLIDQREVTAHQSRSHLVRATAPIDPADSRSSQSGPRAVLCGRP
jgi:hypothetical protein